MQRQDSRRRFIQQALALSASSSVLVHRCQAPLLAAPAPNEKLNLACIGVAAQGEYNLNNVATENIVALCDIDKNRLAKAAQRFPQAKLFADYRSLLDDDALKLDAVVVATPDHTHAIPVVRALQAGHDVYCEKPLAHTVYEVRQMREWAAKQKAITQMGTQIHAGDNYRRVVEAIQGNVIGAVRRVHVWMTNTVDPGKRTAIGTPPQHIDYDLWLGPAPDRPFHSSHFHFKWRSWWDFGGGTLGDFGCHYMDLPFWALKLNRPMTVEASGRKTYEGDNVTPDHLRVDYQFPARDELVPVHLSWYHGSGVPEWLGKFGKNSGVLFEGETGRLIADYGSRKVIMGNEAGVEFPPPSIPKSIGHHQEWISACKTRTATTCNFDYSGALTEAVLLGNVAYRSGQSGGPNHLVWDAEKLKIPNSSVSNELLHKEYRKGWVLEG